MTDSRLRELGREWRKTGNLEDEAVWLLERVRTGDLEQSRLKLAAHCGSSSAAVAIQIEPTPAGRVQGSDLGVWSEHLAGLGGRESVVRVLVGVARALLSRVDSSLLSDSCLVVLDHAERELQVSEFWVSDPNPRTRKHAARLGATYERPRSTFNPRSYWVPSEPNEELAWHSKFLAGATVGAIATGLEDELSSCLARGLGRPHSYRGRLELPSGLAELSLRQEVVPWALGYRDPVRDRVEARQRAEAAGD